MPEIFVSTWAVPDLIEVAARVWRGSIAGRIPADDCYLRLYGPNAKLEPAFVEWVTACGSLRRTRSAERCSTHSPGGVPPDRRDRRRSLVLAENRPSRNNVARFTLGRCRR
jgi:hypothetical protein